MKKTTVDKWKKKVWYKIYAPKEFEMKELGETVAMKPEHVMGRTVKASVKDLLNQIKMHYIKVIFSVVDVKGKKADTRIAGHEINENYLRKFVRRRGSKMDLVVVDKSKDGAEVKLKAVAVSAGKADTRQRADIRKAMGEELRDFIRSTESHEIVVKAIMSEKTIKKIMDRIRKIVPVKRVEIIKSEVKTIGKVEAQ